MKNGRIVGQDMKLQVWGAVCHCWVCFQWNWQAETWGLGGYLVFVVLTGLWESRQRCGGEKMDTDYGMQLTTAGNASREVAGRCWL